MPNFFDLFTTAVRLYEHQFINKKKLQMTIPQSALCFSVLGKRIKQLRQEKGIDQKAFAFDCDIS